MTISADPHNTDYFGSRWGEEQLDTLLTDLVRETNRNERRLQASSSRPMSKNLVSPEKVTASVSLTPLVFAAQAATRWDSPKVRYLSGLPTPIDPNNVPLGGASRTSGALNVTGTHISTIVEGDKLSIMVNVSAGVVDTQVYIDNEPVWLDPETLGVGDGRVAEGPDSGYRFVNLAFSTPGTYDLVIVFGNAIIVQFVHENSTSLAPGRRRFTLGLDGNSYADAGQAPYFGGLGHELMARTGHGLIHFGQGSTGWGANLDENLIPPNPSLKSPFGSLDRQAAWAAQSLDAMLVIGSINSGDIAPEVVADELGIYHARLMEVHPGIPLVVAGVEPWNMLGGTNGQTANNDALREKAATLENVYFIDWYGEQWMTGTGSTTDLVGDGTQDRLVGADQVHPSLAGNRFFAQRFADRLAEIL